MLLLCSLLSLAQQPTLSLECIVSTMPLLAPYPEDGLVFASRLLLAGVMAVPVATIGAILVLVYRIVFPRVLSHPWDMPEEGSSRRKQDKTTTVIFAGSFNPPHWGHLVMIRYLAER